LLLLNKQGGNMAILYVALFVFSFVFMYYKALDYFK